MLPQKQAACTDKVASLSCTDFFSVTLRGEDVALPECEFEPRGTLAIGHACHVDRQCASGVCRKALVAEGEAGGGVSASGLAACGVCVAALPAGAACTDFADFLGERLPPGATTPACAPGLRCVSTAPNGSGVCRPVPGDEGFVPHAGTRSLGTSCQTTADCAQPRSDYAFCNPATRRCQLASRSANASCFEVTDAKGTRYEGCNTEQAGLECSDKCPEHEFWRDETGGVDRSALEACRVGNPLRCKPVDVGGRLGEQCGFVRTPTSKGESFRTVDCAAGLFCKLALEGAEAGVCRAAVGVGAVCDHRAPEAWGPQCERGARCGANDRCVIDSGTVCR